MAQLKACRTRLSFKGATGAIHSIKLQAQTGLPDELIDCCLSHFLSICSEYSCFLQAACQKILQDLLTLRPGVDGVDDSIQMRGALMVVRICTEDNLITFPRLQAEGASGQPDDGRSPCPTARLLLWEPLWSFS